MASWDRQGSDMNILLIGVRRARTRPGLGPSASPLCDRLFIAPGNPGTAQPGTNVGPRRDGSSRPWSPSAASMAIGLVVVGPEAPLVAGPRRRSDGRRHHGLRADARPPRSSKARRPSRRISAPTSASPPPPIAASPMPSRPRPMSRRQRCPDRREGRRARGRQGRGGCRRRRRRRRRRST